MLQSACPQQHASAHATDHSRHVLLAEKAFMEKETQIVRQLTEDINSLEDMTDVLGRVQEDVSSARELRKQAHHGSHASRTDSSELSATHTPQSRGDPSGTIEPHGAFHRLIEPFSYLTRFFHHEDRRGKGQDEERFCCCSTQREFESFEA